MVCFSHHVTNAVCSHFACLAKVFDTFTACQRTFAPHNFACQGTFFLPVAGEEKRACRIAFALIYMRGVPCRYDVFWELSLPLAREAPSFPRSVLSSSEPKSVKHCLEAFFAGEKLEVRRTCDSEPRCAGCDMHPDDLAHLHYALLGPHRRRCMERALPPITVAVLVAFRAAGACASMQHSLFPGCSAWPLCQCGPSLRLCAHNNCTTLQVPQGVEAFFCTACKRHTTAIKTLRLHRLPRVLLLHIKVRCIRGSGVGARQVLPCAPSRVDEVPPAAATCC